MSNLGIFVNRQTVASGDQLDALIKCREAAEELGHTADLIFPIEIKKVVRTDGLFIRHNTDPMNMAFVAAKMATLHNIPVIDDPSSIQICADKINMYYHLMRSGVSIPRTEFIGRKDVSVAKAEELFDRWGTPLVLKEPGTSFSARVEKANDPDQFVHLGRRFTHLSDWIVAQEFIRSSFDWRLGFLDGQLLYACKYHIPPDTFKIQASMNGHIVYCRTESVPVRDIPSAVMETGQKAARAIGNGLYGVDLKEAKGGVFVIEVNDNPSLDDGEDAHYPDIYHRIVRKLLESN
ncbi:MAG TPA: RimK family alpha-L-glutamate ligase [Methanomassiliicoccales archaeon]|nr:RimK family alpha-L-glutamate ligase [Methanomassiliicoccales archaeon]